MSWDSALLGSWPLVRSRARRFVTELRRVEPPDGRTYVQLVVVSERLADGQRFEVRVPSAGLEALRNACDAAIEQLRADDARTHARADSGQRDGIVEDRRP